MCCCSRSRSPSPDAGARHPRTCSWSITSQSLPVKASKFCFSLCLVSPFSLSCWTGATHWLLRQEAVLKLPVRGARWKRFSRCTTAHIVRESLRRIVHWRDAPTHGSCTAMIICADLPRAATFLVFPDPTENHPPTTQRQQQSDCSLAPGEPRL